MRIAIFEVQQTTLTVETDEALHLEQMGSEGVPIGLMRGSNKVVVSPGVYKLPSQRPVRVTAEAPMFEVAVTTNNKDEWPDPPRSVSVKADPAEIKRFFADAKSQRVPM